ncbi:hypothetical protein ATO67_12135 [Agrobacterium bohemicum]|uniref:Uncharacterized protein n=2 Tax=Agrobacterium bohemicum TaxID=2052828 RepID=A0A135P061_9HYPH|nr:hypothetical protein ATO67_12135 [Agrobacterium bohemicum]
MGHFKFVYKGYSLDLPAQKPVIALRASSGSFPGKILDDFVNLDLRILSPKFFFDPNNDPEDDVAQWLNPCLDTQWLDIPVKHFQNRDYRSLETIHVNFQGEGTPNRLKDEDWWEAPGLITTYSDEFFQKAEISLRHDGGGTFSAQVLGETQFGTSFALAFTAPLTVKLTAYRNTLTAEQLVNWFDTFLRKDDFVFSEERRGEDIYLSGIVR